MDGHPPQPPSMSCLECMAFQCPIPDHPCMNDLGADVLWHELTALMETP